MGQHLQEILLTPLLRIHLHKHILDFSILIMLRKASRKPKALITVAKKFFCFVFFCQTDKIINLFLVSSVFKDKLSHISLCSIAHLFFIKNKCAIQTFVKHGSKKV